MKSIFNIGYKGIVMSSADVRVCLLLLSVALCSPHRVVADWPAFRGPTRDGVTQLTLPTTWSQTDNVLWRTPLSGQGWSSPIVVGRSIFLSAAIPSEDGAADNAGYDLCLLILDADSGELLKSIQLFHQAEDAPKIHKKNSHASPTPLFDGQHVYVHFGHQGTACLTLDGEIVWKNEQLSYPPVHGNGGSPTVVGDLLIFSRDGGDRATVTALNKQTGRIVWETQRDVEVARQFSFCTPLVLELDGKVQLILPGSNVVQSLDPATGKEIWRVRYDGYSVIPRPIFEAGLVFICTGYNRPSLLAIDPTGQGDVTETHVAWKTSANIPHTPSLVALDGRLLLVSDKGVASCLDAQTGNEIWKQRVQGNYSASPLLVGSQVYWLNEDGVCTVWDVHGDQPVTVSTNDIQERTLASFAVIANANGPSGDLLLRSDAALYRISEN